jgi:hypothetical protein
MNLNIRKSIFLCFVFLFSGCSKTFTKRVVSAPPYMCQAFPCRVSIESLKGTFPKGIQIPLPYWIYLYRYSKNHKVSHFNYSGNPQIKPAISNMIVTPHGKKMNLRGKVGFVIESKGVKHNTYDNSFPQAKCGMKLDGESGKWEFNKYGKVNGKNPSSKLGDLTVFNPRTPFLLMKNFPKKSQKTWAAFLRCFVPVAFVGGDEGSVVWLRLHGVAAFKWGVPQGKKNSGYVTLTKRILNPKGDKIELAWVDNKAQVAKLFIVKGPLDLLVQLYKSRLISKSRMYRVWEELLRSGVAPIEFIKISSE